MKTLLVLLLTTVAAVTPAFANMPPKDMDKGAEWMTESQIIKAYEPYGIKYLTLHKVPYGFAGSMCNWLNLQINGKVLDYDEASTGHCLYGCAIDDHVVYSWSTRDKLMLNHVLRHELAHALFRWKHERSLP